MTKRLASLLRAIPNPFLWLADKIDPPTVSAQSDTGGGGGPRERA